MQLMDKIAPHSKELKVRKLTPDDLAGLGVLLGKNRLKNIHQIYEIEKHGLPEDQNKFWGIFDGDQLHSVFFSEVLRQDGYGFVASEQPEHALPLLDFAFQNGLKSVIWTTPCPQSVVNRYNTNKVAIHRWRFYKCGPDDLHPHHQFPCRIATPKDIDSLIELYYDYEFGAHNGSTEKLRRQIEENMNKGVKYFVIEMDSKIVVSALVYLETSYAGMIGSARTLPAYRRRGLYKSLRTACLEYLFAKDKVGVAFFVEKNFRIQKMIEKYGGKLLEDWLICETPKKEPGNQIIFPKRLRKLGNLIRRKIFDL